MVKVQIPVTGFASAQDHPAGNRHCLRLHGSISWRPRVPAPCAAVQRQAIRMSMPSCPITMKIMKKSWKSRKCGSQTSTHPVAICQVQFMQFIAQGHQTVHKGSFRRWPIQIKLWRRFPGEFSYWGAVFGFVNATLYSVCGLFKKLKLSHDLGAGIPYNACGWAFTHDSATQNVP